MTTQDDVNLFIAGLNENTDLQIEELLNTFANEIAAYMREDPYLAFVLRGALGPDWKQDIRSVIENAAFSVEEQEIVAWRFNKEVKLRAVLIIQKLTELILRMSIDPDLLTDMPTTEAVE